MLLFDDDIDVHIYVSLMCQKILMRWYDLSWDRRKKTSLKIPKGQSVAANGKRTD
jgi:hypothetical protein